MLADRLFEIAQSDPSSAVPQMPISDYHALLSAVYPSLIYGARFRAENL